jgi:RNA polymerase sigma-70 factor (ECF subfamily)
MPSGGETFVTTRWSLVCAATEAGAPGQAGALEELCRAYWLPLYAFVRRSGYAPEDARDLTQAFFARLIERDTLARARAERGRFRTFLLAVLRHFLADQHDRTSALKRGGSAVIVELDIPQAEERCRAELTAPGLADAVFDRRWALVVLERAAARLREEFTARGRERVFEELKGFLLAEGDPERFRVACAKAGITLNNGRVTLHRLRQRLPALIREEVAQTVRSADELEAELRYLLEVLSV